MAITPWDLKECSFSQNLLEVEELSLANKGIVDLGAISEVPNVKLLNLSFNSLSSVAGLCSLHQLQNLNISHNNLAALKGVSSLTSLTVLNASHNKLASISGLTCLTALTDLWLQNNQLRNLEELRVLSCLTALARLCLSNNPVGKVIPPAQYRAVLVSLSPSLQVIDAKPVTQEDRDAGTQTNLDALMAAMAPSMPRGLQMSSAASSTGSSPSQGPGISGISRQNSRAGSASSGSSPNVFGSGTLPGSRVRGRMMPGSRRPSPSSVLSSPPQQAVRSRSQPTSQPGSPTKEVIGSEADGWEGIAQGQGSGAPSDWDQGSTLSYGSTARSTGSTMRSRSVPRRIPAAQPRPLKELPEGSSFLSVLDKLPKFETSKLPTKYTPATVGGARKPPPPRPPPGSQAVEYECRYPQGQQGRALTVRQDGSAACYWPNGDIAVTVDVDYGGSDVSYRLFSTYRSGAIAASWDSSNGFVQHPSGSIMVMYNGETGTGTAYSASGEAALRWNEKGTEELPPEVSCMLDQHLGIRYLPSQQVLQIYLSCEGVRVKLVCGFNQAPCSWDPSDADAPAFARQLQPVRAAGSRGSSLAVSLRSSGIIQETSKPSWAKLSGLTEEQPNESDKADSSVVEDAIADMAL